MDQSVNIQQVNNYAVHYQNSVSITVNTVTHSVKSHANPLITIHFN